MKRVLSLILSLVLLLTIFPAAVFADGETGEEEPLMTGSEKMYDYIKNKEGCRLVAYKNPGETNWTIGYGHCGPDVYEGMTITQEEADALFVSDIAAFEDAVRKIGTRYGYDLAQNEFDALLSLCYNFGTNWVEYYAKSWRLARYIQNDFHKVEPLELVDSMAVLCNAGSVIYTGLILRRFEEAKILLYGVYPGDEMPCPDFVYIKMDADGGNISGGNRVKAYYKDEAYGELPTATKDGFKFLGWETTDGVMISGETIADKNRNLTAKWQELDTTDPPPTTTDKCDGGDGCPSKDFADISAKFWAHEAVDYVVSAGLFNGVTKTSFEPDTTMNRGMLVTVLYRLSGSPSVEGYDNPFNDLRRNAYYDAILWASHNRIANGYYDGSFRADETLSREQLATFLCRYAGLTGRNTDDEKHADLSLFTDSAKVAAPYVFAMEWAVGQGIINGTSTTTLSPDAGATRAQVATMLMRFVKNYLGE